MKPDLDDDWNDIRIVNGPKNGEDFLGFDGIRQLIVNWCAHYFADGDEGAFCGEDGAILKRPLTHWKHLGPPPRRARASRDSRKRGTAEKHRKKVRPALGGEPAAANPVWGRGGWGRDRAANS